MVVWLIGMSGAGKTVVGRKVYELLNSKRPNVVFFDGDIFREIMGNDLGHTLEDRKANAWRISRICKYLNDQGIDVVFAILSIFPDMQDWNREHIKDYFEVYIRVPFNMLVKTDTKGIYQRALDGKIQNVVGVDIEFPEPIHSDLVIDNDKEIASISELAHKIVDSIPREKA